MTKYIIAVLLAVCALLGGFSWYQLHETSRLSTKVASQERLLKESEAQINRLSRTASKYAQARDAAEAKTKETNRALEQTLKANPAWAEQPLPDGVAEWLRDADAGQSP